MRFGSLLTLGAAALLQASSSEAAPTGRGGGIVLQKQRGLQYTDASTRSAAAPPGSVQKRSPADEPDISFFFPLRETVDVAPPIHEDAPAPPASQQKNPSAETNSFSHPHHPHHQPHHQPHHDASSASSASSASEGGSEDGSGSDGESEGSARQDWVDDDPWYQEYEEKDLRYELQYGDVPIETRPRYVQHPGDRRPHRPEQRPREGEEEEDEGKEGKEDEDEEEGKKKKDERERTWGEYIRDGLRYLFGGLNKRSSADSPSPSPSPSNTTTTTTSSSNSSAPPTSWLPERDPEEDLPLHVAPEYIPFLLHAYYPAQYPDPPTLAELGLQRSVSDPWELLDPAKRIVYVPDPERPGETRAVARRYRPGDDLEGTFLQPVWNLSRKQLQAQMDAQDEEDRVAALVEKRWEEGEVGSSWCWPWSCEHEHSNEKVNEKENEKKNEKKNEKEKEKAKAKRSFPGLSDPDFVSDPDDDGNEMPKGPFLIPPFTDAKTRYPGGDGSVDFPGSGAQYRPDAEQGAGVVPPTLPYPYAYYPPAPPHRYYHDQPYAHADYPRRAQYDGDFVPQTRWMRQLEDEERRERDRKRRQRQLDQLALHGGNRQTDRAAEVGEAVGEAVGEGVGGGVGGAAGERVEAAYEKVAEKKKDKMEVDADREFRYPQSVQELREMLEA